MRRTHLASITARFVTLAIVWWLATPAWAQNDWQYPDPYFGILEIEKSHDGATARRYRGEVNPAPRSSRFPAPSAWQSPAGESAGPAAATPAPVTRPRWRNRWRR
jgi:hypothetical protein